MTTMKAVVLVLACVVSTAAIGQAPGNAAPSQPPSPVTEISADLGSCSVDFHVTDLVGAGLYNAEIKATIRYGFMSKRKLELQAGTNADGRARFIKLPAQVKQPLIFEVRYKDQTASLSIDPGTDCHAQRDVPLSLKGK
jgi:hypothetical protein